MDPYIVKSLLYTMNTSIAKAAAATLTRPGVRQMSSTAKVWVDKNTRVICQGFTGKQVRRNGEISTLSFDLKFSTLEEYSVGRVLQRW